MSSVQDKEALARRIEKAVAQTKILDIHTHLYDPAFGELLLWGIDDLLVYHYLVAESFRYFDFSYEKFWAMSKTEQADRIWQALFIQNSPISDACRGVLGAWSRRSLGVTPCVRPSLRKLCCNWKVEDYGGRCMELAGVDRIC